MTNTALSNTFFFNDELKESIFNTISSNSINSFIISGPQGLGKTNFIINLSKFILCELENENSLNLSKLKKSKNTFDNIIKNKSFYLFDNGSHPDFFHLKNTIENLGKKIISLSNLNLLAKNLGLLKENKNFFTKDLEKNIYLYEKNHLINLNILNFVINTKIKFEDFSKILNKILKSKIHQFTFDGKYLMKNGMKQGSLIGKVLKEIEKEWINNNFKISKERVKEIIQLHSN